MISLRGRVMLRTAHGRYVGVNPQHQLVQEKSHESEAGSAEVVEIVPYGSQVAFKTSNGRFIQVDNNNYCNTEATAVHGRALFTPEMVGEHKWAFRGPVGLYLCAEPTCISARGPQVGAWEIFEISARKASLSGRFLFKTGQNTFIGVNHQSQLVQDKHHEHETGAYELIEIESHGSQVALKTGVGRYIQVRDDNYCNAEATYVHPRCLFTPQNLGENRWAFLGPVGLYLCAEPGVVSARGPQVGAWETFVLTQRHFQLAGSFLLKTAHEKFVGVNPHGQLVQEKTDKHNIGASELVQVEPHGAQVAFKTANGYYIQVQDDNYCNANSPYVHARTLFTPQNLGDDKWAFRGPTGLYLCAEDNGCVSARGPQVQAWETFKLKRRDQASSLYGRFLFKTGQGRVMGINYQNQLVQDKSHENDSGASEVIEIEAQGDKVAFKTASGAYIHVDDNNYCQATSYHAHDRCLFTPQRVGEYKWAFRGPNGLYLCAEPTCISARGPQVQAWETFELVPRKPSLSGRFLFRSAHGYIGTNYNFQLVHDRHHEHETGYNEMIEVIPYGTQVAFKLAATGRYIQVQDDNYCNANAYYVHAKTLFNPEKLSGNRWAFRAANNLYLCGEPTCVSARGPQVGEWESFELTQRY